LGQRDTGHGLVYTGWPEDRVGEESDTFDLDDRGGGTDMGDRDIRVPVLSSDHFGFGVIDGNIGV
jgi:hypothetical protein